MQLFDIVEIKWQTVRERGEGREDLRGGRIREGRQTCFFTISNIKQWGKTMTDVKERHLRGGKVQQRNKV